MSLRSSVKGESGPSWSEISRTFHGQSVVIAVSEMQKNAYTNRSTTVPMTAPELSVLAIAVVVPNAAAAVSAAARSRRRGGFRRQRRRRRRDEKARRAAEKTTPPPSGKTNGFPEGGVGFGAGASFELAVAETETDRVTSDSRGETPPRLRMAVLRRKTTPPQPPLTYAPKEHFPEKVPTHPRRGRRGDAGARRGAREGARARVDATACGVRGAVTRAARRATGAAGRNSPPGAAFRNVLNAIVASRFSLERVKRGRAFRGSSARGRLPERRGRMLYDLFRRATTPNATTSDVETRATGGRPALFLGGRDEPRAVVAGPARGVASPSFLQTRVANSPAPFEVRAGHAARCGRGVGALRCGFRADHAFDFRARARHVHEHAQPPPFLVGVVQVRVHRRRGERRRGRARDALRPTRRRERRRERRSPRRPAPRSLRTTAGIPAA